MQPDRQDLQLSEKPQVPAVIFKIHRLRVKTYLILAANQKRVIFAII